MYMMSERMSVFPWQELSSECRKQWFWFDFFFKPANLLIKDLLAGHICSCRSNIHFISLYILHAGIITERILKAQQNKNCPGMMLFPGKSQFHLVLFTAILYCTCSLNISLHSLCKTCIHLSYYVVLVVYVWQSFVGIRCVLNCTVFQRTLVHLILMYMELFLNCLAEASFLSLFIVWLLKVKLLRLCY